MSGFESASDIVTTEESDAVISEVAYETVDIAADEILPRS